MNLNDINNIIQLVGLVFIFMVVINFIATFKLENKFEKLENRIKELEKLVVTIDE